MEIWTEYAVAETFYFPLIDRGTLDFESTPVTFAAGDVQYIIDGAAAVSTTNLPSHEDNGIYSLDMATGELTGKRILLTIIDQTATKLWEDQALMFVTFGDPLAQYTVNFNPSGGRLAVVKQGMRIR